MKLKRIEFPYDEETKGCKGCAGVESNEKCEEVQTDADVQGLGACGKCCGVNHVYVEDKSK